MPSKNYKYKAFISYSHQDKKWGDWLHKTLETYRIPKGLVAKQTRSGIVLKRPFPIFRYREVLPTSSELGDVIGKALARRWQGVGRLLPLDRDLLAPFG